jgi:hypothetical protein
LLSNSLFFSPKFDKINFTLSLNDNLFLIGSCFSENISQKLRHRKFNLVSNPFGVLFDPISIEKCIYDIVNKNKYSSSDMFFHNELYGSWAHHGCFSNSSENGALENINQTIVDAKHWLKKTNIFIITLGSAYVYYNKLEGKYVANCHKVSQSEFNKELITIVRIVESLNNIKELVLSVNPSCKFIVTISPVRHLRDGVIENNRSKARLIEAINLFTQAHPDVYYFPSYEIVIDVLRDYRFFDVDFAHPNSLATDIVYDYFKKLCISESCWDDIEDFYQLYISTKHRSRNPETVAHKKFLETHLEKAKTYQTKFPYLNFSEEINCFTEELF